MVHADETGFKQGCRHKRGWLWTVVAPTVTVFVLALSRSGQVIRDLLGADYKGIVVSDRWSGYAWLDPRQRQVCWAHLKRDFQGLIDRGGQAERTGRWLMSELDALFACWHRWRDGDIDRSGLQRKLQPVRMRLKRVLSQATCCPDRKARALCKNLLKLWQSLFTFATASGVEPTNNTAERSLRPAVQHRKISYGTKSDAGARFFERTMTVSATCRQQGRDVLDFLVAAVEAFRSQRAPPSLLAADQQARTAALLAAA